MSKNSSHDAAGLLAKLTDPHRLAAAYRKMTEPIRFYGGEFWGWVKQRYVVVPAEDIRAEITAAVRSTFDADRKQLSKGDERAQFDPRVTRSLVSNVMQALAGLTLISRLIDQPAWVGDDPGPSSGYIAVENGLLDVDALLTGAPDVLHPHSPDWFSQVCLDYPYLPGAGCPKWLAFLEQVLEGDTQRLYLMQEIFGYMLTPDTSLQRFFSACGEGANGKTVVTDVLTALLGKDNVSHVRLELFGDRFQLTTTLGKLGNIVTEIGEMGRVEEGTVKAFVSGDRMFFDRKNQTGIQARPTARIFVTTNTLPHFQDRSIGIWRRLILIPFRVSIPESQQDPHLVEKLILELSGILNWAIEGLRRLRVQGHFTKSAVCQQALEAYQIDLNPARAFLAEDVQVAPTQTVLCRELYSCYRRWCRDRGHRELNDAQFGKEVVRVFPDVRRCRGKAIGAMRPWQYDGIAFKVGAEPVPASQTIPISDAPDKSTDDNAAEDQPSRTLGHRTEPRRADADFTECADATSREDAQARTTLSGRGGSPRWSR
jgi:putative DNA primase/helicase